jgi:DNA-binding transcriptional LysR family regulator
MFDLNKLRIFIHVTQGGSFSAAAQQLYMSQSAVSQHMQELEAALGVKLFQRGRRGVMLTIEGGILREYAQRIINLTTEAENALLNVANIRIGKINIGATSGVSAYLLPTWTHDFQQRYPRIVVATHTTSTSQIMAQLDSQKIDLGFFEGDLDLADAMRLEQELLCEVPQLLIVGPQHAFWKRKTLAWRDLQDAPFITHQSGSHSRLWLDHVLQGQQVRPKVVAEFDNLEAIKRSIFTGGAMTIMPAYAVANEISQGQLRAIRLPIHLTRMLRAVWNRNISLAPIARAFMAYADACLHTEMPRVFSATNRPSN